MGWLNNRPLCLWLYDNMLLITSTRPSGLGWIWRRMGLLLIHVNIRSLRAIVYYVQDCMACGTRLSILTDYCKVLIPGRICIAILQATLPFTSHSFLLVPLLFSSTLTTRPHLTCLTIQNNKMSYEYEPITTYFKPTIWSEDVSTSVDPEEKAEEQIKDQFGLVSNYDWKSFKESIEGKYFTSSPMW